MDPTSQLYDALIVLVSLLSLVPLMVNEGDAPYWLYHSGTTFDRFIVIVLFFDYIMKWMTQDLRLGQTGLKPFILYPLRPMSIITFLSIIPSLGIGPNILAILRLVNIIRISRYSKGLTMVVRVVKTEGRILFSVFMILILYIFSCAIVVYVVEPETFKNFFEALYWAFVMNTSVGFGDIVTKSYFGRIICMFSSLVAIALIALPSGIITAGFVKQMNLMQKDPEAYCRDVVPVRELWDLVKTTRIHITESLNASGKKGFAPRLAWILRTQRKFRIYSCIMLICFLLDILLYFFSPFIGLPFWLDMTGTALAAIVLEPAAGILIGFANNLFIVLYSGGTGSILFFFESAITAVAFGVLLARGKKVTFKSIALIYFFCVFVEQVVDFIIKINLKFPYTDSIFYKTLYDTFGVIGLNELQVSFFASLIAKAFEVTIMLAIVLLVREVLFGSRFASEFRIEKIEPSKSDAALLERVEEAWAAAAEGVPVEELFNSTPESEKKVDSPSGNDGS